MAQYDDHIQYDAHILYDEGASSVPANVTGTAAATDTGVTVGDVTGTSTPVAPTFDPVLASAYASTGNVTTSGALALSSAVSAGETVVVTVHGGGTGITFGVSDSQGNTWQSATLQTCTTTPSSTQIWWTVVTTALTTSDTITVTRSAAGGLGVQAWKLPAGFSATAYDSDGAISNSASTSVSTPAVSVPYNATAATYSVALMAGTTNTGRTATATSPYTLAGTTTMSGTGNPRYGWTQWNYFTAAGTSTPASTLSSGNTWAASTVVFEALPVGNTPPTANAGPDQIVHTADLVTLDGTGSTDSDGTITGWQWTQVSGTTVTLSGATTDTATFTAPSTLGALVFELEVTDNNGATATDTVTITPLYAPTGGEIGDSLTERATTTAAPPDREATTRALFAARGILLDATSFYWDGLGGRSMTDPDTFTAITATKAQVGPTPDYWVIALGTNDVSLSDTAFENAMQAIIDAIGAGQTIIWVNLAFWNPANTNAAHFNPIIAAKCAANGVILADWYTSVHTGFDSGDWIGAGDPTHMTVQGYARRDRFIADQITLAVGGAVVEGRAATTDTTTTQGDVTAGASVPANVTGQAALVDTTTTTGTATGAATVDGRAGVTDPTATVGQATGAAAVTGTAAATDPTTTTGATTGAAAVTGRAGLVDPATTTGTATGAASVTGRAATTDPTVTVGDATAGTSIPANITGQAAAVDTTATTGTAAAAANVTGIAATVDPATTVGQPAAGATTTGRAATTDPTLTAGTPSGAAVATGCAALVDTTITQGWAAEVSPLSPAPTSRTLTVAPEDRTLVVELEDRTVVVAPELRVLTVGTEDRLLYVHPEDRTLTVEAT